MMLNDPFLIDQAKKGNVQEMEVLYWMLEDAIYGGNLPKAKGILTLLFYSAKYRPDLIQKGLRKTYRERLKEISHDLFGNGSKKKQESITIKPPIGSKKIPFKLESELKSYLTKHPEKLKKALKEDYIRIVGTEIETDDDYKCDIVVESKDYFYPIELKISQTNHSVVSQCSKYCYYFYRQLRYSRFKKIQGIVIGPGFDAWSINELRREGHWIFLILLDEKNEVQLRKIENN